MIPVTYTAFLTSLRMAYHGMFMLACIPLHLKSGDGYTCRGAMVGTRKDYLRYLKTH